MSTENFFNNQTPSSKIKAKIISEYFPQYCKIILSKPQYKIGYVDLFAGPGVYNDGNLSTPILIAKNCAKDQLLRESVWFIFNDNKHCATLAENFNKHLSEVNFKFKPEFKSKTVGEDEGINTFLRRKYVDSNGKNIMPTVLFIDPFGYKGVNTNNLAEFLKQWGNEIFLFLNTKKINWATQIGKFDDLMNELFPTSINKIRADRKYKLTVTERLNLIIENLAQEYRNVLGSDIFYTAFRFQEEDSEATSHYVIHFTKSTRGYDLIKQVYDEFDNVGATLENDGTYTFDAKKLDTENNLLFDTDDLNIENLYSMILEKYSGSTITAYDLYEEFQPKNRYSRRHYTLALRKLTADNKVISTFTDNSNHLVSVLISRTCKLQFN